MKKKNIKKIHSVLLNIKEGTIEYPNHGICLNLQLSLDCTNCICEFLENGFTKIYGEHLPYPIEGDSLHHFANKDKWNSETDYGKKRLELLQKLIDYAEELINE